MRSAIVAISALTVILWQAMQPQAANLEQVAVGDQGQAFLVGYLGKCFAVLPAHVMGGRCGANLTAPGSPPVLGHGALLLTSDYESTDLAVLEVSGALKQSCSPDFAALRRSLQQPLKRSDLGVVSTVDSAGGGAIMRLPVLIDDVQESVLWVSPQRDGIELAKGISGAVVSVQDTAVGMILGVDASFGAAKALRMDTLMAAIDPFFSANVVDLAPLSVAEHCVEPASPDLNDRSDSSSELNVAAAAKGARLIHWSVPLHDPEQNPQAILSSQQPLIWEVSAAAYPVNFVIDLAGDDPVIIHRFEISTTVLASVEATPRHLELFASASATGSSWHSIQSLIILPSQPNITLETAPTQARRVMIKVYDNYGDPSLLALYTLKIFSHS